MKLATRAPAETHSDCIRLSRRPLKSDGGSFSRATSQPFKTRSSRSSLSAFYWKDSRRPDPPLERVALTAREPPWSWSCACARTANREGEKPVRTLLSCRGGRVGMGVWGGGECVNQ